MSYRTHRSVRCRYRCCTDTGTNSGTDIHTVTGGTGINVVPNLPKCTMPVLMSYRTYRSVRHRYRCRTGLTKVSVPDLPKCPVPVLMLYRNYQSVRYRYESLYRYRWYRYPCRTELTEVSGSSINVVPNFPKCPVPVLSRTELTELSGTGIESYRAYRSVRYR